MNTILDLAIFMAVNILFSLFHVHHVGWAERLQSTTMMYTSHAIRCSPHVLENKTILQTHENSLGQVDCVRQCTGNYQCQLVVYQEFGDMPASCTKLSESRVSSRADLDMSNSKRCVVLPIYPCLNGGQLHEGVCLCRKEFTGPVCEYGNPSVCDVEWTEAASIFSNQSTVYNSDFVKEFNRSNPKVIFRNQKLNVVSVMRGMEFNRDVSSDPYWYLITFQFFEKIAWNKFAPNPQRQFMHFLANGVFELLSFNRSNINYSFARTTLNFRFVMPRQSRFSIERQMPNDWELMNNDLGNGYELFGSTLTSPSGSSNVVVSQLADRKFRKLMKAHFFNPPQLYISKSVLGFTMEVAIVTMSNGQVSTTTAAFNNPNYLNPCWTGISEDKNEGKTSDNGWKMLRTYLRRGNDVRIKIEKTYQTVIEVIQIGDSLTFLLAASLSQGGISEFTLNVHGVRSMISSADYYEVCTHKIEGEKVINRSRYKSSNRVLWFVDTRIWRKVFTVSSNSSVLEGSVIELASGVTKGSDVRVWIQWLRSGVSRFLDTHMSSVTDDGKVSTESLVTWGTTIGQDSLVHMNDLCDMEYVLVTSDGHVEILLFNIGKPGKSTVQRDVIITWFLA